jgi:hypothetical protein
LAAIAIRRGRVHVDARVLLTETLSELVADPDATAPDAAAVEALVSRATDGLARDDDPTWALTDRIARLRDVDPDAVELAVDWLDALLRHRGGRPS